MFSEGEGEGKSVCLKSKSLLVCPQMPLDCYQIVWASSADEARLCPEIVSHPRRLSAGEEQLLIIVELILDHLNKIENGKSE